MGFNLCRQRVPGESQVFNKFPAHDRPIDRGLGNHVGRERSGGATELSQVLLGRHPFDDGGEPVGKHGNLFAHCGRGGWLSVGSRQHGLVFPGQGKSAKRFVNPN